MFTERQKELAELRYAINKSDYLSDVRKVIPYVDGKMLTTEFDALLKAKLGEKTPADDALIKEMNKKRGAQ